MAMGHFWSLLLSVTLLRDGFAEGASENPATWDGFTLNGCMDVM